jgi:hypothetical protein
VFHRLAKFILARTAAAAPILVAIFGFLSVQVVRSLRNRHRGRSRDGDFWWKVATGLLYLAGVGVVVGAVFEIRQSNILGPEFYSELSNFGTFVAALAAWFSVLSSRRADRRKNSTQAASTSPEGMNAAEYKLMTEILKLMADGTLNDKQIKQLKDMAGVLLAARSERVSEPTANGANQSNPKPAHGESENVVTMNGAQRRRKQAYGVVTAVSNVISTARRSRPASPP